MTTQTNPTPRAAAKRLDAQLASAAKLLDAAWAETGRTSLEPGLALGRIAWLIGRATDATALVERAVAHHPDDGLGWLELGRLQASQSQWDAARSSLARAAALLPFSSELIAAWGVATFRAGNGHEALRILGTGLQQAPGSLELALVLSDVLVETGHADLADELLENATHRFPGRAETWSRRAALAMRRGAAAEAIAYTRRHLELTPEDVEGWLLLGVLTLAKLDLDAAEEAVTRALDLAPGNWRAHFQLGGLQETLRLLGPAELSYRKALALEPSAWRPRNNLALLLLERGTPTAAVEARALLEAALELAPTETRATVHYNLALACLRGQDPGQARRHAEQAQAGAGTAKDAQRLLEEIRAGGFDTPRASAQR